MREEPIAEVRTPLLRLDLGGSDSATLWVKRDDLTHPIYGGNKVRKLRHILADAQRRKLTRIVTFGAAGSHHVLATSIFAARAGLRAAAVLTPQPRTRHAEDVLRAGLAAGLEAWPARVAALAPWVLLTHRRATDLVVPPGGSNVVGAEGYVDGARELAGDIARGELPEPDVVVVPVGSGGTAAGLAVGLADAGVRSRVHGVAVYTPAWVSDQLTRRLIRAMTVGNPQRRADALARLTVDGAYAGGGYGVATDAGERAASTAATFGLGMDPTYSAKTFACALDLARRNPGQTILYWHTLSSAPMEPLLSRAPAALPPALDRLFVG